MEGQTIVVALIVIGAAAYSGSLLWKRFRSFSVKKAACADDCGCSAKSGKPVQ
jgi:hypothetical protein